MTFILNSYRYAVAAGPFDPTTVAGCVIWFDADDPATLTLSGSNVTSWANKGSSGLAAVRAGPGFGATTDPVTGSVTQNGRNALEFNTTSARYMAYDDTNVAAQPLTVTLAAKIVTRTSGKHLSDGAAAKRILVSGDANWRFFAGTASIDSGVTADTSWHVIQTVFNGASSVMYIDNVQVGSTGNPGSHALSKAWVFPLCDSHIGDVIVHNTALGSTDRGTLAAGLKTKWGTP